MATSITFQTQYPQDNFDETPIPEKLVLGIYLALRAVPKAAIGHVMAKSFPDPSTTTDIIPGSHEQDMIVRFLMRIRGDDKKQSELLQAIRNHYTGTEKGRAAITEAGEFMRSFNMRKLLPWYMRPRRGAEEEMHKVAVNRERRGLKGRDFAALRHAVNFRDAYAADATIELEEGELSELEMLAGDDDLEDNMEQFEQEETLPGSPEIFFALW
jgi:hypothetical protein